MLQQTRVTTVLDYYERFLRRFPTLKALAGAQRQEVLKEWEGLGYYRRAVHLHEAAKQLSLRRSDLPESTEELRRLPGVGSYTAAAIASIAFGIPVAAVDGNVARILARLLGLPEQRSRTSDTRRLQAAADALLSKSRPGDFNQAWMDLGSLICTPRAQSCPSCPLRGECHFAETSHPAASNNPTGVKRKKAPKLAQWTATVYLRRGRMLVRRRPESGLWSGLWEFPTDEITPNRRARGFGAHGKFVGIVSHELTHLSLRIRVRVSTGDHEVPISDKSSRWVTVDQFSALPVSTAYRKVFDKARPCVEFTLKNRAMASISTPSPVQIGV